MIRSLGSGYCGRGGRGLNIENCRLKNGDSDGRLGTEEGRPWTVDGGRGGCLFVVMSIRCTVSASGASGVFCGVSPPVRNGTL